MSPGNVRRRREIKKAVNVAEKKRKKAERKASTKLITAQEYEKKIAELIAEGKTPQEAAEQLKHHKIR